MNSALKQQISSFDDEKWLAEQWLINSGIVPDSSIDALLLFAYSQSGVLHNGVTLELNRDEGNEGKNPSVTYKIKLEPRAAMGWKAIKKAEQIKNTLLRKAALLGLAKAGAPYAIDQVVEKLAQDYLPKQYKVEVHILE